MGLTTAMLRKGHHSAILRPARALHTKGQSSSFPSEFAMLGREVGELVRCRKRRSRNHLRQQESEFATSSRSRQTLRHPPGVDFLCKATGKGRQR